MELFEDYRSGRRGAYDEMFHDGELRTPAGCYRTRGPRPRRRPRGMRVLR